MKHHMFYVKAIFSIDFSLVIVFMEIMLSNIFPFSESRNKCEKITLKLPALYGVTTDPKTHESYVEGIYSYKDSTKEKSHL